MLYSGGERETYPSDDLWCRIGCFLYMYKCSRMRVECAGNGNLYNSYFSLGSRSLTLVWIFIGASKPPFISGCSGKAVGKGDARQGDLFENQLCHSLVL